MQRDVRILGFSAEHGFRFSGEQIIDVIFVAVE